jgi:hypothetical protein
MAAGLDLGRFDAARKNELLVAVTERRSREEIDRWVAVLQQFATSRGAKAAPARAAKAKAARGAKASKAPAARRRVAARGGAR